ncbi:MAG TPA: hypothetical protein VEA81_00125 [Burkholderiaceae bacterium]|nr:hypothetical protein [Burkholderiaceae bacterium]
MKRIGIGATLTVAALVLAGCSGGGDGAPPGGAPAASTLATAAAPSPAPAPAPAPAATPAPAGNAAVGKTLWTSSLGASGESCASCHGDPRDNVDNVQRGAAGWEAIARAVQIVPTMATAFGGRLTPSQREDLSAFLATPTLW